jgi:hypothetical protein
MTCSAVCASGGYAISLEDLAKAHRRNGSRFISPDLRINGVTLGGYTFAIAKGARKNVSDVSTASKPRCRVGDRHTIPIATP